MSKRDYEIVNPVLIMNKHETRTGDTYDYENGFWDAKDGKPKRIAYMTLDDDHPRRLDYIDGYYAGLNEKVVTYPGATYADGTPAETPADTTEPADDPVNHPSHYCKGGIECLDAIRSSMTDDQFCGFLKGNILKYIWRYEDKNKVEDLKKAQFYLNRLLAIYPELIGWQDSFGEG